VALPDRPPMRGGGLLEIALPASSVVNTQTGGGKSIFSADKLGP